MNSEGDECRERIEEMTQSGSPDVRICPVHRVWKDGEQTVALFFDTDAINGCREESGVDCSKCPSVVYGSGWTRIKILLDLIERELAGFDVASIERHGL